MPGGTFSLIVKMERRALFTSNLGVDLIRLPDELERGIKKRKENKRYLISGSFYR